MASLPHVELAAICGLIPEKAQASAERFGVPRTYQDYRQMLAEADPQALYVIMPPQHLFEPVAYALKQRRHAFIEKPPALTTLKTKVLAHNEVGQRLYPSLGFVEVAREIHYALPLDDAATAE